MGFPDGWSDADRYTLLRALQLHMTEFIYSEDEEFAALVQRQIRNSVKPTAEIIKAIRDLMMGLEFAIKSRNFRNEAMVVDDEEIYPHERLYDTLKAQPENRLGGVWDPDELRNGLTKMRTHRHSFDASPDLFFRRTLIWSKSVAEMRTKFYLWREIYVEGKKRASEIVLSDVKLKRVRMLSRVFEGVPPAPPPTPSTPNSMASPGGGGSSAGGAGGGGGGGAAADDVPGTPRFRSKKSPKQRAWTVEEQERLVALLVELTLELQTKGESGLLAEFSPRLNRTLPSLVGKINDIRVRFESKKTPLRAAVIPSVIYDTNSVAHKIFTADWSDREEPYSLGYHAVRQFHNRCLHDYYKKTRTPPPRRMETRQRTGPPVTEASPPSTAEPLTPKSSVSTGPSVSAQLTSSTTQRQQQQYQQIHPVTKPPRVPVPVPRPVQPAQEPVYSEFVRDCTTMLKKWGDPLTYRVCAALQKLLPTYASLQRTVFYENVALELANGMTRHELWLSGERVLRLCEKRYGSLDCFAAAIEGSGDTLATDAAAPMENEEQDQHESHATPIGVSPPITTPVIPPTPLSASPTVTPASVATPTPHDEDYSISNEASVPGPKASGTSSSLPTTATSTAIAAASSLSFGKSNEAVMHLLHKKAGSSTQNEPVTTPIDLTDESPASHHFSPGIARNHYDFDYDPGTPEDGEDDEPERDAEEDTRHDQAMADIHHRRGVNREQLPSVAAAKPGAGSGSELPLSSHDHHHHHHHRHRHRTHHHRHHHRHHQEHYPSSTHVPSKVHVSKTLVIHKAAPEHCQCDECSGRRTEKRRRQRDHHDHHDHNYAVGAATAGSGSRAMGTDRTTAVRSVSIHHKRHHHHEMYAYESHAVAHKRSRYDPLAQRHEKDDDGNSDSEDDEEEEEEEEQDLAAMDAMWAKLMAPIESDIQELEAKRREQLEREQDRQKQEQKTQWKQDVRMQVRAEWDRQAAGANAPNTTGDGEELRWV